MPKRDTKKGYQLLLNCTNIGKHFGAGYFHCELEPQKQFENSDAEARQRPRDDEPRLVGSKRGVGLGRGVYTLQPQLPTLPQKLVTWLSSSYKFLWN